MADEAFQLLSAILVVFRGHRGSRIYELIENLEAGESSPVGLVGDE